MRRESSKEREAWTALIEGRKPVENKYGNDRSKRYASKHEADTAMKLGALERAGYIAELREQVSFTLVEGKGKIRPIKYVADFVYQVPLTGTTHVVDAKGCKTPVYRLKRKLAALMLGIVIEEV
jgi:Protein of unknown function (DUF1064)